MFYNNDGGELIQSFEPPTSNRVLVNDSTVPPKP
jgi:hypothetical protein